MFIEEKIVKECNKKVVSEYERQMKENKIIIERRKEIIEESQ